MEATPFEHEEVALATKLTLEPTVLLFVGLLTVTPANADNAMKIKAQTEIGIRTGFFIRTFLSGWDWYFWSRQTVENRVHRTWFGGTPWVVLGR